MKMRQKNNDTNRSSRTATRGADLTMPLLRGLGLSMTRILGQTFRVRTLLRNKRVLLRNKITFPRHCFAWLMIAVIGGVLPTLGSQWVCAKQSPVHSVLESNAVAGAISPPVGRAAAGWNGSTELLPMLRSQDQDVDGEAVRRSIQRGVRFLLRFRGNDDNWPEYPGHPGGTTALAVLALLNSGADPESPELRSGLRVLATQEAQSTYASSLIIMALAEANPQRYRDQIQRHVDTLLKIQDQRSGGFSYSMPGMGEGDSSNSQFAILALHEAQKAGIDVDRKVWEKAQAYWKACFNRRGGFMYQPRQGSPTGSMTCAGICSLLIVDENLSDGSSEVRGDNVLCCRGTPPDPMIEAGIDWLGRNFSVLRNPSGVGDIHGGQRFYYLYSLERAGRLSGRRFFGTHDWYREGVKAILQTQRPDGGWQGNAFGESDRTVATAMSLLFLAKGLRPILMAKYRHGEGSNWDPHPLGVQYLTRFVEKTWNRRLNWQTIEAANASPNDLLETPVLYITGDRRLKLSFDEIKALKEYIDNGGFLFFESENGFGCPDAKLFDQDVRELLSVLIPEGKLEVLKPDHLVWSSQFPLKPDQDFPVLGIQSCCRTSVIYCPSPMSGFWQLNRPKSKEYPAAVREKIEYSVQLATNILAFATGNELKDKLDRPKLEDNGAGRNELVGRRILIPKLRHNSGFDDAPMALSNLLRRVSADRGVQFQTKSEFVAAELEKIVDFPIVFVHGRGKFSLSNEEKEALKEHLARGGFIFGDSICGDPVFYESFKDEMRLAVEAGPWQDIPADDPIYSGKYGGYDLDQVQIKLPKDGKAQTINSTPKLESLMVDNRHRVIFSRYDLSCALENGTSSSCYGYTVTDAAKIGANILLYALQP